MKQFLFSVTRKDFDITYFSGTGKGGQNRNRHQNCCRIKHKETGVITTGQEERSKEQNLRNAFKRMVEHSEFKNWLRIKIAETCVDRIEEEKEINRRVDAAMREENLRIEVGV